jgi:Ca2+-binding EF-hand superfamily protein
MSKASKAALVLALALGVVASTAASGASQRTWNAGEKRVEELLRLMDKDKNGKVSKEEFLEFMSAEFDRVDKDKNGELTTEELSNLPYSTSVHVSPHR